MVKSLDLRNQHNWLGPRRSARIDPGVSNDWEFDAMRVIYLNLLVLMAISVPAFGQTAADPWLILASGEQGSINVHTTREDLVRKYGAANVVDRDEVDSSGFTVHVTVLFPRDSRRCLEISWRDEKETAPAFITITGAPKRWHAVHNISTGMSLKELEQLNGGPFQLAGFGWDYEGTIESWASGSLAGDLDTGHGRVLIRLCPPLRKDVSQKEFDEVTGSGSFPSSHPIIQKLNPRIFEMTWLFPEPVKAE